ncbi:MAG: DUF4203 domain-containing protein [Anaerolineae bacterium]
METLQALLVGALIVIIGLFVCFGGYGFWRIALVIGGFIAGYALGAAWIPDSQWFLQILVGVVIAIIGGVLAYFLWSLGMVLAGLILGAALGGAVLTAIGASPDGILTLTAAIIGGVIGAVLVYFLKDVAVIIILAFAGAAAVSLGIVTALPTLANLANPADTASWFQNAVGFSLQVLNIVIIFGLGIIGSLVQYALFRAKFTGELYFEEQGA